MIHERLKFNSKETLLRHQLSRFNSIIYHKNVIHWFKVSLNYSSCINKHDFEYFQNGVIKTNEKIRFIEKNLTSSFDEPSKMESKVKHTKNINFKGFLVII